MTGSADASDLSFVDRRARGLAADPGLNIALEASAGTGKTRVLVERYLRLVEEGASPRHILALTFTRKAAGEMKHRILEQLRARPALWNTLRARLYEIHITTIDAFCLGLLREFPLEAGLDPDLELIDEVDGDGLLEEAIDTALAEGRRGRGPDAPFLVSRFGEPGLRRGMREFLRSRLVKADLLTRWVSRVVPRDISLSSSLKRVSESCRSAFRGSDGLERFLATGPSGAVPAFDALSFAARRSLDPERIAAADVEELVGYFLTRRGEPRKRLARWCTSALFGSKAEYETHRDRVLGLAPLMARHYSRWVKDKDLYAIRELSTLYRSASKHFQALKSARAGLDFTDVLLRAVELLEKRGEFSQSRFRLESRYHHLLIDEFQDTNDVQWRLVQALVDAWGQGAGLVQEAILAEQAAGRGEGRLQEPTLFIVGDRKQSIYGWRDARVEVMDKAARRLLKIRPGGGKKLTIRTSFRAGGALLDFLNQVFHAMPKVRRDLEWSFQYRNEDHFPVLDKDNAQRPVAIAAGRDLKTVADAVADEIVRILSGENKSPRDIAILFRSRSSYRVYEKALAERGVPAYVYRGLGFFDSPEVRDLTALVRFLAEPGSELRACELARSRLIGLSDTALALIAARSSRDRFARPVSQLLSEGLFETMMPLPEEDRLAAERARTLAPAWLARVDRVPPADQIEQVLEDVDYAAWFVGQEQSWENLKKVLELVRRAQNRGYLTLSRLGDYLESASSGDESLAALETADAVNLMTIHAAKGLEFDTVFLVNMQQSTRRDSSLPRVVEHPDGRIEISALAAGTLDRDERTANRVEEEEKRLLYVALTRPRRQLVLSSVVSEEGERERSFLELLPASLGACFREALATESPELVWESKRGLHPIRVLRPHPAPMTDATRKRLEGSRAARAGASNHVALEALPASSKRVNLDDLERGSGENIGESRRDRQAVHALIGLLGITELDDSSFDQASILAHARDLLEALGSDPEDLPSAAERVTDLFETFRAQSALRQALGAGTAQRNVGFSLADPNGRRTITGVIDCLVIEPKRITIIELGTKKTVEESRIRFALDAIRSLYPEREVTALLFTADAPPHRLNVTPSGSVGPPISPL